MLLRRTIFLLSIITIYCACSLTSKEQCVDSWDGPKEDTEQKSFALICDMDGFTEEGTWLKEVSKPFIVREIKGRIIPENVAYSWPYRPPMFEIRAMGKGTMIHRTQVDKNGRFILKDIPEGIYCFYISCPGWEDVIGAIIVDKDADRARAISLVIHQDNH